MFFFLSKIFFGLIKPLTISVIVLLVAIFKKNPELKRKLTVGAVSILLISSNEFIVNELSLWWDFPPATPEIRNQYYDVAIILTGGMTQPTVEFPTSNTYLHSEADRFAQPLLLYKAGKVSKILISGGFQKDSYLVKGGDEGQGVANFLVDVGVKKEDIILEKASLNTRQNAVFTAKILKEQFPNQSYLLCTSATHMRRAKACFQKEGVNVTLLPTTHKAEKNPTFFWAKLYPNEEQLFRFYYIEREVVGYILYKIAGYI